jgi:hypothetical protein
LKNAIEERFLVRRKVNPWPVATAPGSDLLLRQPKFLQRAVMQAYSVRIASGIPAAYDEFHPMSHPKFEFDNIPRAYLITFRGHGTWLHGDKRGSVDRDHNRFGTPRLMPNERRRQLNVDRLKHPPVRLPARQREAVESAIKERAVFVIGICGW